MLAVQRDLPMCFGHEKIPKITGTFRSIGLIIPNNEDCKDNQASINQIGPLITKGLFDYILRTYASGQRCNELQYAELTMPQYTKQRCRRSRQSMHL